MQSQYSTFEWYGGFWTLQNYFVCLNNEFLFYAALLKELRRIEAEKGIPVEEGVDAYLQAQVDGFGQK